MLYSVGDLLAMLSVHIVESQILRTFIVVIDNFEREGVNEEEIQ